MAFVEALTGNTRKGTETMREYIYYTTLRPASPGTIPREGLVSIEHFEHRTQLAFCKAWSRVTYSEPLTPETLTKYELSDNTPEEDDFIQLEKIDPLIIFKGNASQREAEERKEERNESDLHSLYTALIDGLIDYFYTVSDQRNGYQTIFICHPSSKYDTPQLTAVTLINGLFAHMTYDCQITDFRKLCQELPHNGRKVFYSSLDD